MKFTAHTSSILTTIVAVTTANIWSRSDLRTHKIALRIDGRSGSWRVDLKRVWIAA